MTTGGALEPGEPSADGTVPGATEATYSNEMIESPRTCVR